VLARRIADGGRYPAIDVEASVSRVMHDIATSTHSDLARRLRQLSALYEHNRDLIAIGAYQRGSDPRVDEAIARWPQVESYLRQDMRENVTLADSIAMLRQVVPSAAPAAGSA
jgi:flagellum-specific ATP synthase